VIGSSEIRRQQQSAEISSVGLTRSGRMGDGRARPAASPQVAGAPEPSRRGNGSCARHYARFGRADARSASRAIRSSLARHDRRGSAAHRGPRCGTPRRRMRLRCSRHGLGPATPGAMHRPSQTPRVSTSGFPRAPRRPNGEGSPDPAQRGAPNAGRTCPRPPAARAFAARRTRHPP
jgi:hypothetical protein